MFYNYYLFYYNYVLSSNDTNYENPIENIRLTRYKPGNHK